MCRLHFIINREGKKAHNEKIRKRFANFFLKHLLIVYGKIQKTDFSCPWTGGIKCNSPWHADI